MDNNFMENCKLLKKHFTKLTPQCITDESTQSIYKTKTKSTKTKEIIEDAKKLLLEEKLDILCDSDLDELKQNTLAYAKQLEEYGKPKVSYRNCQKNQNIIQWDDEIFSTPLPHPKYNSEFIKAQINCDTDNKMIDCIDDIKTVIEARICTDSEEQKTEVPKCNIETIEDLKQKTDVPTCTIETIEDLKEIKTIDVPELNIIPQSQNNIENLLQIKKLNLEENETKNFDDAQIVSNNENYKMDFLKKSVNKWKTVIAKKNYYEKTENQPHNKKIDDFLQNIQKYRTTKSKSATNVEQERIKEEEKKPKSSTSLDNKISSYQYRFKAQKNIIEMQKEKLQEQMKIIEELKLKKIHKQASESLKDAQKTKRSLSPQKVKLKKKVNEENDKEERETINYNPSLHFAKAPKIVVQMEERAKEREEKRLIIKERRRLIEEDKKKQTELILQKKMRDEMEERDKQKEKMRAQRERVRQLEIKRQQEKKRYIELNEIAQRHYRIKLMKNNGMDHFKMLIFRIRINMEIAKRFYENNLIINGFKTWKGFAEKEICYKNELADELYNSRVLKIALRNWKTYHLHIVQSTQVAVDWYEVKLQIKFLKSWHLSATESRLKYICDVNKAKKHHERLILFQTFESWRSFPALMEIERIQNERKRKWRLRVAEILSDYDPLKNYE